jgi:hypothetical protein
MARATSSPTPATRRNASQPALPFRITAGRLSIDTAARASSARSEKSSAGHQEARPLRRRCKRPGSGRFCDNRHNARVRTAECGRSRLLHIQADGSGKCRRCRRTGCYENLRPEFLAGNNQLLGIERRDYISNPQHLARNSCLARIGISNRRVLLHQQLNNSPNRGSSHARAGRRPWSLPC